MICGLNGEKYCVNIVELWTVNYENFSMLASDIVFFFNITFLLIIDYFTYKTMLWVSLLASVKGLVDYQFPSFTEIFSELCTVHNVP